MNTVAARDGTTFTNRLLFDDLYGKFGNSWQVKPADSLLSDCGPAIATAGPQKPFYATDLDPKKRETARATCLAARVERSILLDDCTLDVAVLGKDAARAYVAMTPPAVNGNPVRTAQSAPRRWIWLLVLIALAGFAAYIVRRRRPVAP